MPGRHNHRSNVTPQGNLTLGKLDPGDLVRLNYVKGSGERSSRTVLVLNPDADGKIHALDISYLPERSVVRLYARAQAQFTSGAASMLAAAFPLLLMPEIRDQRAFYQNVVKPVDGIRSAYRTFRRDRVADGLIEDLKYRTSLGGSIQDYA